MYFARAIALAGRTTLIKICCIEIMIESCLNKFSRKRGIPPCLVMPKKDRANERVDVVDETFLLTPVTSRRGPLHVFHTEQAKNRTSSLYFSPGATIKADVFLPICVSGIERGRYYKKI